MIYVGPGRFEEMVAIVVDQLPAELAQRIRNVAVLVEHRTGPPGLLGLYEGTGVTSYSGLNAEDLPDRITIYRQAICAICSSEQEVADRVYKTVIHEIGHYFGWDDYQLHELGW